MVVAEQAQQLSDDARQLYLAHTHVGRPRLFGSGRRRCIILMIEMESVPPDWCEGK